MMGVGVEGVEASKSINQLRKLQITYLN